MLRRVLNAKYISTAASSSLKSFPAIANPVMVETPHSEASPQSKARAGDPRKVESRPSDISAEERRRHLLNVMKKTSSMMEAWDAYHALRFIPRPRRLLQKPSPIPLPYLHRLAALVAATKPRTRTVFLRLYTLLSHIRNAKGSLFLWERNALIDCAGKGFRRTTTEAMNLALGTFQEMFEGDSQVVPGTANPHTEIVRPDIITYTTLISIAARTCSPHHIRRAISLLTSSGLKPNRITHLSLLRYFTETKQLHGVRATLRKMQDQGLEVGIDGINAVLWAYSFNGQMDIASIIYRVLRHQLIPETAIGGDDIDAAIKYLANVEHLVIPDGTKPDDITYATMIQSFAYTGELLPALQVFSDMLSAQARSREEGIDTAVESKSNTAIFVAFRALFIGFARHGISLASDDNMTTELRKLRRASPWTLRNLEPLFNDFISYPGTYVPNRQVVFWIITAFIKTSDHNVKKLDAVFTQLTKRFGKHWEMGRLGRLRRELAAAKTKEG
jgi:hypothetical protein